MDILVFETTDADMLHRKHAALQGFCNDNDSEHFLISIQWISIKSVNKNIFESVNFMKNLYICFDCYSSVIFLIM